MKPIKKIAVLTSGGDAPGMNSAIRAVVYSAAGFHVAEQSFIPVGASGFSKRNTAGRRLKI